MVHMASQKQAAQSRRDAVAYIAALREEREGYERRGDKDHLRQIDAEIRAAEKLVDPAEAKKVKRGGKTESRRKDESGTEGAGSEGATGSGSEGATGSGSEAAEPPASETADDQTRAVAADVVETQPPAAGKSARKRG